MRLLMAENAMRQQASAARRGAPIGSAWVLRWSDLMVNGTVWGLVFTQCAPHRLFFFYLSGQNVKSQNAMRKQASATRRGAPIGCADRVSFCFNRSRA